MVREDLATWSQVQVLAVIISRMLPDSLQGERGTIQQATDYVRFILESHGSAETQPPVAQDRFVNFPCFLGSPVETRVGGRHGMFSQAVMMMPYC